MSKKSWGVSWVIEQLERGREYRPRSQNYVNERKIYACPLCDTAYQVVQHKHIQYYDFPKYKLEKEICPNCN